MPLFSQVLASIWVSGALTGSAETTDTNSVVNTVVFHLTFTSYTLLMYIARSKV
eukprot:SAG11_NODE_104_length_16539_cov_8.526642_2_plen_54_part_00